MSHNDSFIDEVTEEVRRDRLFALMRKYGWIGIVAVFLVVGGAAWVEWQKARARAAAEAFGSAVLGAMESDDAAARVAALEAVAAGGALGPADAGSGRRAVLELLAANEALLAEDRDAAIARLRAVGDDVGLPQSLRQLAQLKLVMLAGDKMDAGERDAVLAALATPGAPYRVLAMEQQALVLVAAGQKDAAIALLRQVLQEPAVTTGLRRRATQVIVALGGAPEAA